MDSPNKAEKVIMELSKYGGFDDWWDNIDLFDKDTILRGIECVIKD